ncbi:ogr/Delta-like zinc finger family protein [Pseudomonas viridiflava]|uniref:ogr/Delta-like zinc finger family protein n=1 Tax=Pseudomonas viridiflava TaxID=33069 RepID=UPI0015E3B4E1|nr:ogr/Delta-like zinc finger family protein [Pseudomonas viridiflava]MBA1229279.1 ogr/Delta-like zinc finger family protein [Pseudomonas viridiflava]
MRIKCTSCAHKGRISSREEVTAQYVKLYCQCLDASCGHTWVSTLTFSHTLRQSARQIGTLDTALFDRLSAMPVEQQLEILQQLEKRAIA